jgi:hypothetical protein
MKNLWLAACQTARIVGPQRKLWLPFLAVALVEILLVVVVWLAPHPPFSKFLAPPIRYFFSDRVLHYPAHLWFLFHAMKHTHVVASTLVGAFMTGIACVMVQQTYAGKPLSLRDALVSQQVRYGPVVVLWILSWGLAIGMMEAISTFAPKAVWVLWTNFGVMVVLQALLVYAIPAAVFERSTWARALFLSVRETLRHPLSTLIVVAISGAVLLFFAMAVNTGRVALWMSQTTPEIAVLLSAVRLIVWTLTDAFMTITIAHLWWIHRLGQPAFVGAAVASRVDTGRMDTGRIEEGPAVA